MNTLNNILTNGDVENLNRYNDNAAMVAAALIMDCDDRAEALMNLADLGLRWNRFAVYSLNADGDLANGALIGCYSTRMDAGFNAEPFEAYAIVDCESHTIDWGHAITPDSVTVMPEVRS